MSIRVDIIGPSVCHGTRSLWPTIMTDHYHWEQQLHSPPVTYGMIQLYMGSLVFYCDAESSDHPC